MLAKDLTMADYFAGYVNRLPNRKVAIKEISRKLSAKEIESLMGAFSESQQDQRPDTNSRPSAFENHDPIR